MKSISFILGVFMLLTFSSHAQLPCGTPSPTPQQYQYTKNVISQIALQRNGGTTCIPIRVHIVRHSDGTGGVTMQAINEGLAELNQYYLVAGIEFYLCGETPDYLDNDTFYEFEDSEENAMANAAVEVNNALNLYFVNTITIPGFGNAAGYAYFPFNSIISTRVIIDFTYANFSNTMVHEMGHWFSLYHTFEGTSNGPNTSNAENVARPPSPNANCSDHGDLICDTQADPGFTGSASTWDWATCSYIGTATDANGELYTPDIDNIMSYYPSQCQDPYVFTPEQYTRIEQGLISRQGHGAYSMDCAPTNVNDPSNLTASFVDGAIELNWTDNSSNEMGFLIERSTTSAVAGFEPFSHFGTAPNITNFTDNSNLAPSTTYWYRVKASNDNCNDYSNVASYTTGLIYCTASATCDEYISQVIVGDINNSSACGTNGYSNYSTQSTEMVINQSYPLTVNNGIAYNGDQCGVWVDWNQDGDFEDANETIVMSGGAASFSGFIVPPAGAVLGETTMRVRITYTGSLVPCGNLSYGETEDYSINVIVGGNPGTIQFSDLPLGLFEFGTHELTVSRTGGSDGQVSVTVTSQNGTAIEGVDFEPVNEVLTWADGELGDKTFTITIIEDEMDEGTENFNLSLTNVVNASLGTPNTTTLDLIDYTTLSAKVFLEGPYDSTTGLMSDNLRAADKIPLEEPFTALGFTHVFTGGGETTTPAVLAVTGDNAIVDWVFVEIHSFNSPSTILVTMSALLQKDGDIVMIDGISPLRFSLSNDYIVVIRQRNHFGVRSLNTLPGTHVGSIDFTDPTTPVFGTNAMKNIDGVMVMIAGDANRDGQINAVDKNGYWRLQNGLPFDYINSNADFNLDGAVNAVDKNGYWRVNNSMIEQLE